MNQPSPDWRRYVRAHLPSLGLSAERELEIVEELAVHLEAAYEGALSSGTSEEEARARALAQISDWRLMESELSRSERRIVWQAVNQSRVLEDNLLETKSQHKVAVVLGSMIQDLRYGLRLLRKNPGFTTVAVLTLALGIGANTAMFSVLNTYLFRALPYPDSARLVRVFRTSPHSQSWPHSVANFLDLREQNNVFEQMVAFIGISPNLIEEGEPAERLRGLAVTADFFPALSVEAALGRGFTAAEDQPGADRVVVLSDRFWQRRFGGDPDILGRTLRLDDQSVKVIGVMPPGFDHPLLWGTIDLWRPMAFTPQQRQRRGGNYLGAFARLKPGVSLAQAQEAMVTLFANIAKENSSNSGESIRLDLLQRSMSDEIDLKTLRGDHSGGQS